MTAARIARRKATRRARWSSARSDPARLVALHPFSNATANQCLDPLSGPRHTPAYPPTGRPSQLLHPKSTIVTVPLEVNSP